MTMNDINPEQIAQDIIDQEKRQRRALRVLLDRQGRKKGHLFACQSKMGNTVSYVTSVPLGWVESNVRFARDLPIFAGKVDPISQKIPIDEITIGQLQQRSPDWRRQIAMTMYLAMREHRKFPPLLVVAYQPWAYDETEDEWSGGVATRDSINVDPLNNDGQYVDIDTFGTSFYALDGQHRLMAIRGLSRLIKDERLYAKRKDGSNTNTCITMEDLHEEFARMGKEKHASAAALQDILSESIGIEIIPSVARGEEYKESLYRLRNAFVDVNETAKKITRNEANLLDEIEGFRIVARNVAVSNTLLVNKTDMESQQLNDASNYYTTLDAVVRIAENYLGQLRKFSGWNQYLLNRKDCGRIRPSDEEVRNATKELDHYFEILSTLPSHKRLINGSPAGNFRTLSTGNENGSEDQPQECEDNALFRPIAQMALSDALGFLVVEKDQNLESLVAKIARQEKKGQLKLSTHKDTWFGVLRDSEGNMRKQKKFQDLATKFFIYLLGGGCDTTDDQDELLEKLWDARRVGAEEEAYGFDGEKVVFEAFHLPAPWQ